MTLTLIDRLDDIVKGGDAMNGVWGYPYDAIHTRQMSEFEDQLRDWGVVYGMAYVLARMEDPFESTESVAQRALKAAKLVFKDYIGKPLHRPAESSQRVVV